jgi:cytochrome c oxidase subunit 2
MSLIERFGHVASGSSYAAQLDGVFDLIFWLVGFWTVVTFGAFFYLIARYRKREGEKAEYLTGDEKFPKKIITWAHALVIVCDVFIIYFAIAAWYHVKQELPDANATVRVIAQQWAWSFVHPGPDGKIDTPDDIKTVDELHIEVGKLYHYKLEARDVLHSFSVPVFRLKQDAIPGRVITGWFQPTLTGAHDIQCAEICGIGHGLMPARVVVETAAEHAAWMAEKSPISLAALSPSGEE